MWPNSFLIRVGDHPITVGCDDDATAARLRTLATDAGSQVPASDLVHYGVRIDSGEMTRPARALCVVQHGSASLGRSTEPERVLDGFWRTLGAHRTPPSTGMVRLDAAVVRGPAGIILVPRSVLSSTAPGWLRDHHLYPVLVHHVDVGVDTATGVPFAQVAAPLDGEGSAIRGAVHTWVLDLVGTAVEGLHLADVVAHLAADLATEVLDVDSVEHLAAAVSAAAATDRLVVTAPGRRPLGFLVDPGVVPH